MTQARDGSSPNVPGSADEVRALADHVKRELRQRMRGLRSKVDPALAAEWSTALAERVTWLPEWQRAKTVASFVPFKAEIDAGILTERARGSGKRIALPRIDVESRLLVFHDATTPIDMTVSSFGVTEPIATAAVIDPSAIDLVIVPGLAFDPEGGRIGYGQGHYDRVLAKTNALTVGVGFDFQILAELPMLAHDQRLDVVVTPTRVFRVAR